MSRLLVIAAALAALALAGARAGAAGEPFCAREARWAADNAAQVLHHYDHDVYPADVALISFQTSFARFRGHGCAPKTLGLALKRRLTRQQRTRLLEILPPNMVPYLRRALAAS